MDLISAVQTKRAFQANTRHPCSSSRGGETILSKEGVTLSLHHDFTPPREDIRLANLCRVSPRYSLTPRGSGSVYPDRHHASERNHAAMYSRRDRFATRFLWTAISLSCKLVLLERSLLLPHSSYVIVRDCMHSLWRVSSRSLKNCKGKSSSIRA